MYWGRTKRSYIERSNHCYDYEHLDIRIPEDGKLDKAIRNAAERKAIKMLNSVLWDKSINKTNKKRIYETIVRSIREGKSISYAETNENGFLEKSSRPI